MTVLKVCAGALICSLFVAITGKKSSIVAPIGAFVCIMIAAAAVDRALPVADFIGDDAGRFFAGYGNYVSMLFRSVGAALICEVSSGVCRDCGEEGIASRVEMFCRIEIVVICFPLLKTALETARQILTFS